MIRVFIVSIIISFLLQRSDVKTFRGWSNLCLGGSNAPVIEELQLGKGTFTAKSNIDYGIELQISWSGNWMRNRDTLVLLNIKETKRSTSITSPLTLTDFQKRNPKIVTEQLERFISIHRAYFIVRGDTIVKIIKGTGVLTHLTEKK